MVTLRHIAFVFAVVFVPCGAAGQNPFTDEKPPKRDAEDFAEMKVAAWTTAVRAHAAGSVDEPVTSIASWPRDHVGAVLSRLLGRLRWLRERADVASTAELKALATLLERGLSLHTDIAIAERDVLAQRSSTDGRAAVLLVDGHEAKHIDRSLHWVTARQIAAALAAVPDERPRVLAWYRAIANGLQQRGDYDLVAVHLEEAQKWFAGDAMLSLYQGTLHQTLGDARLRRYAGRLDRDRAMVRRIDGTERPEWSTSSNLRHITRASRVQLKAAEREFRRAVSADPDLHEARIRLAHVLSTLSDDQGAADTVRPALRAPLSPFLDFYAALILGRSEEHLGRYAEADQAYARAAARFPAAPSARIGRSRVALAQGRAAEALALVVDVTTHPVPEGGDPWLFYLREHDPDGGALLVAWRASLPGWDGR